jgi:hypothetical protein
VDLFAVYSWEQGHDFSHKNKKLSETTYLSAVILSLSRHASKKNLLLGKIAQLEASFKRISKPVIDLIQIPNLRAQAVVLNSWCRRCLRRTIF